MKLALSPLVQHALPSLSVYGLVVKAIRMDALQTFRIVPPLLDEAHDGQPVGGVENRKMRRQKGKAAPRNESPGLDLYQAAALFGLTPFALRSSCLDGDALELTLLSDGLLAGEGPAGARSGELVWHATTRREVSAMSWGGEAVAANDGMTCHIILLGERLHGMASPVLSLQYLETALQPFCSGFERVYLAHDRPECDVMG